MPKLRLIFGERVLEEIPVGPDPVTIGRLPDNTVVIDNPAVSGRHARVGLEGERYFVQDLESLNGTVLNDRLIVKEALRDGDVIQIGKHKLVFQRAGKDEPSIQTKSAAAPKPSSTGLNRTVFLDTRANKDLLARLSAEVLAQKAASGDIAAGAATGEGQERQGTLEVVSGSTDMPQYVLRAKTTVIGKSSTAQVRLRGWFKPAAAAAITRVGSRYSVMPMGAKTRINGERVTGERELNDGDLITVGGVRLRFALK